MADCAHCKHLCFFGGFEQCDKDLWHELDEPCEEFDEYTSEDAYWDKYAYQERFKEGR